MMRSKDQWEAHFRAMPDSELRSHARSDLPAEPEARAALVAELQKRPPAEKPAPVAASAQDLTPTSLKGIRTAAWTAIAVAGLNLVIRLLASDSTDATLGGLLISLSDPLLMLGLAYWLLRKQSRAASVSILLLFLLGKLVLFLPFLDANLSPAQQDALTRGATTQIFWIGLLSYAFWQGISGSFAYQRQLALSSSPEEASFLSATATRA